MLEDEVEGRGEKRNRGVKKREGKRQLEEYEA